VAMSPLLSVALDKTIAEVEVPPFFMLGEAAQHNRQNHARAVSQPDRRRQISEGWAAAIIH